MLEIGRSVFVLVLLCSFTVATAQLPPEIMADKYLIQAERLHAANDHAGALSIMEEIITLQKEHDFTLRDEFHFVHAKIAHAAGSIPIAIVAVTNYLTEAGREGKFYREALELLEEAERLENLSNLKCSGEPKGTSCWMEVTGQPECYVWNGHLDTDETVTWTGECSGGRAVGNGTLRWLWNAGKDSSISTGRLTAGKRHGHWVFHYADGGRQEGPFVDGKVHGNWVIHYAFGKKGGGPYVDAKRHGHWVFHYADGRRQEGPYVDGKKHGHWVEDDDDGDRRQGPYVDGKKHGNWVERSNFGSVSKGPYVEGKPHGHWVHDSGDGYREEGPYAEGKRHGNWTERSKCCIGKGRYVNNEKDGTWYLYDNSDRIGYILRVWEYRNGKRVSERMGP